MRVFQRFFEVFRGSQSLLEVFRVFFRGFRFFGDFQRSSQRPSQRQISLSEPLSPVAPIVLPLLKLSPKIWRSFP